MTRERPLSATALAYRAGQRAAATGRPRADCPHGSTLLRGLRTAWLAGFDAASRALQLDKHDGAAPINSKPELSR